MPARLVKAPMCRRIRQLSPGRSKPKIASPSSVRMEFGIPLTRLCCGTGSSIVGLDECRGRWGAMTSLLQRPGIGTAACPSIWNCSRQFFTMLWDRGEALRTDSEKATTTVHCHSCMMLAGRLRRSTTIHARRDTLTAACSATIYCRLMFRPSLP